MTEGALIGAVTSTVSSTVLPVLLCTFTLGLCGQLLSLSCVLALVVFPVQMSSWFEFPPSIGALACLHEGWTPGACVVTGGLSGIMSHVDIINSRAW